MMSKWEMVRLGDIFDIGSSKRVFESQWRESGVPFYRAREIVKLSENETIENGIYIEQSMYDKYAKIYGIPSVGDIMVTGVGTLGVCYIVKPDDKFYFKDGNILWFKRKTDVCSAYVSLVFKSNYMKEQIAKHSSGTTVGTFTIATAKKIEIPLPPLDTQKKIADILDRAAALIEKRKAQIEKLDLLVKSQFIEMFGDPMTNPMGWEKTKLGNLTDNIIAGESLNGEARQLLPGEKAVLKVSAVTYGFFKDDEYKVLLNADEIKKNVYPRKGDLLFSRANTREMVGATALVKRDYPDLILPDKLWKLVLSNSVNAVYVKFALSSESIRAALSELATGTSGSMYNISMEKLRNISIPVSPLTLQNCFADFVHAADKSKFEMQRGLVKLELLYKSLMQKCFVGELVSNG